jgi:hypothetical protein
VLEKKAALPPLPHSLKTCFDKVVGKPDAGEMNTAQVVKLITDLKRSESGKTSCGKRLIAFYEDLRS